MRILAERARSSYRVRKLRCRDQALESFIYERARGYFQERAIPPTRSRPCSRSARNASIWCRGSSKRCARSRRLPEAESLAAANKRIGNILKQAGTVRADFDVALLVLPEEKALAGAFKRLQEPVEKAYRELEYTGALKALAALKAPVDAFFDKVMVMVKDARAARQPPRLLGDAAWHDEPHRRPLQAREIAIA